VILGVQTKSLIEILASLVGVKSRKGGGKGGKWRAMKTQGGDQCTRKGSIRSWEFNGPVKRKVSWGEKGKMRVPIREGGD